MSNILVCTWTRTQDDYDDYYETSCDKSFMLADGTPKQNKMRFCCYCGKPLEQKP